MKRIRYVVWVNDDRFLYRTFRGAVLCASRANAQGKDTFLYPEHLKIFPPRATTVRQAKSA